MATCDCPSASTCTCTRCCCSTLPCCSTSACPPQVVICNDRGDLGLQNCQPNTGAFGSVPALNQPFGIAVGGDKVWISERNPARVRVCSWYSRFLTDCNAPSDLEDSQLTHAGQVAVSDGDKAYVAIQGDSAIVQCNNPLAMSDCETLQLDFTSNPVGLYNAGAKLWIGAQDAIISCPIAVDGRVQNDTCTSTPVRGRVAGVAIDGNTAYLAQPEQNAVQICTVDGNTLTGCQLVTATMRNEPGAAGLSVFEGKLYTPQGNINKNLLSVCSASGQGCLLGSWPINPPKPTSGSVNIAHAPAPLQK